MATKVPGCIERLMMPERIPMLGQSEVAPVSA